MCVCMFIPLVTKTHQQIVNVMSVSACDRSSRCKNYIRNVYFESDGKRCSCSWMKQREKEGNLSKCVH